jgi:hypothetical protein
MAKWANDDVMDAALNRVKTLVNLQTVCSQQPTTRTEATTTYKLADVAMATGDFTLADGDAPGRKVTVAQKASVTVDSDGTATHVALTDATSLVVVTTCTGQVLTSGNTVTFPAWDQEISDPA